MQAALRLLRRPEAALFALVFVAYAYFYQAGGWNQNSRFALVRSIVEDGTSVLDRYRPATWDLACKGDDGRCANVTKPRRDRNEHYYCDKAPGSSWLGVPVYWLTHQIAGSDRPGPTFLAVSSYLVTVFSVSLPTAISAVMLSVLLGAFGIARWPRVAAAAAYGLGTLAFPYATLYYGHQLVAALVLIAFALLVRARHSGDQPGRLVLVGVGLLLGSAVVVEYPAALAVTPLLVYAALFVRPWPRLLWIAGGMAIPGMGLAAYHWIVFGGPLTLPYEFSTQGNRSKGWFMGLGAPSGPALWGILGSGYRGLFYSAPWLLLAAPGAVALWRRRFRAEVCVSAAVVLLFLWLNSSLVDWSGGWAMGARYLIPAIPFLAVLAGGVGLVRLERTPVARGAWAAAGLAVGYSVFMMLVGTAVKPEVPDQYGYRTGGKRHTEKIERPFAEFLLPSFWRGDLSVSSQAINTGGAPHRHSAELPRPRFTGKRHAWNLGQKLGLGGLASLIPLLLLWAGGAVWLRWSIRAAPG